MKVGMIGAGRMGKALTMNMRDHGHQVVIYNRHIERLATMKGEQGINIAPDLETLTKALPSPRVIWIMVTAGDPVDQVISALEPGLSSGDILIDGGNSNYRDTQRRSERLKSKGITLLDVGTSSGIEGAARGTCLMVGGDFDYVKKVEPLFIDLSVEGGYGYFGPSGAGHFVKMVQNGIEYGMMEAIGEGFSLLDASEFDFDHEMIAKTWSSGSVIESYLMRKMIDAFHKSGDLAYLAGIVDSSGSVEWAVSEAIRLQTPIPVISNALYSRFASKDQRKFAHKSVAALRHEFGGHTIYSKHDKGEA